MSVCIDVFSGVGGLGMLLPLTPVLYVEKDAFAQSVLEARMVTGALARAPILADVRTVPYVEGVHYIIAGFPCQSVSSIGKQTGLASDSGTQSSLFHSVIDVAVHLTVPCLFLENVEGLLQQRANWEVVLQSLHSAGYDVYWTTVGACRCGAPHQRLRWFALCLLQRGRNVAEDICVNPGIHSLYRSGTMVNGLVQSRPWVRPNVQRHHWATPRAACFYASGRRSTDLGTQARVAQSTGLRERRLGCILNPDWVEWLMGFPIGWTDAEARTVPVGVRGDAWRTGNATMPRLICRRELNHSKTDLSPRSRVRRIRKRNTALGNACVPQCSLLAWTLLHNLVAMEKIQSRHRIKRVRKMSKSQRINRGARVVHTVHNTIYDLAKRVVNSQEVFDANSQFAFDFKLMGTTNKVHYHFELKVDDDGRVPITRHVLVDTASGQQIPYDKWFTDLKLGPIKKAYIVSPFAEMNLTVLEALRDCCWLARLDTCIWIHIHTSEHSFPYSALVHDGSVGC